MTNIARVVRCATDKRVQVAVGYVEQIETGVRIRTISAKVRATGLLRACRKLRNGLWLRQTESYHPKLSGRAPVGRSDSG